MIRVTTWNIWWRFGPWEQRHPAIVATLEGLGSDVICLQEVWSDDDTNQADSIAGQLGLHAAVSAPAGDGLRLGNAILSRHPITDTTVHRLPGAEGKRANRTALVARIDAPFGELTMVSTHLAYRFDESALRSEQLAEICRIVAGERGDPEHAFPPIVCGDLNAVPTSDEIRRMTGESPPHIDAMVFTDAWAAVGDGPGHTWDSENPHLEDTTWPRRRLDYVLIGWPRPKPFGNAVRASLSGNVAVDGVWPSDHFAVTVDLVTERTVEHPATRSCRVGAVRPRACPPP